MPPPTFDTQWEEDSYWKHYENYLEQKAYEYENNIRLLRETAMKELLQKHGPAFTRRGTILEKDGWETITSKKLNSQLRLSHKV